jgi:hypothetical protein
MVSSSPSGITARACSASTSLPLAFSVDQETTASRRLSSSTHPTTYSVSTFVEKDVDLLDVSFLNLLRNRRDEFVSVRFALSTV